MNAIDAYEAALRGVIADCLRFIDGNIRRARQLKRGRVVLVLFNCCFNFTIICSAFYRSCYFEAIFQTAVLMVVVSIVWRVWERRLLFERTWKRRWAACRLDFQKELERVLRYKERGFE